jgi:Holliday junction resolvase RusA-like endonuclease
MNEVPRVTLPLRVFVPSQKDPIPQPRARACRRGAHAGVYNPDNADGWKARIAAAVLAALPGPVPVTGALIDWPVAVNMTFLFRRPKSHFRGGSKAAPGELKATAPFWHTSKPDRDNLDKAVLDALVHWRILADDSLVCLGIIGKRYVASNEVPGVHITICHPIDVWRGLPR